MAAEGHALRVVDLRDDLLGTSRTTMFLLLGAAGCVLLIGCANVVNLLLGRSVSRQAQTTLRIALGATRRDIVRLFVLETAWKIDNTSTQEARTDIAAVKYTMARVLREVSFNALHILGSLGTTDLTPLQAMYAAAPTMGIADGVDGAELLRIEGAGHLSNLEAPETFDAALAGMLTGLGL